MTGFTPLPSEKPIAACCADFYGSDMASWLLGDSFHPGGIELTDRLGELLELDASSRVLDLATGRGASAIHLAERFGCEVVGLDYGRDNIAHAIGAADRSPATGRLTFLNADVQQIPVQDGTFDAVICECSFCTFASKPRVAAETFRVLRPGGRLGLSDLSRQGRLPDNLEGLLGHVLCIADACPVSDYHALLENAGLCVERTENRDDSLRALVASVRSRLIGARLLTHTQGIATAGFDIDEALEIARSAARAVDDGTLGYTLITARR